MAGRGVQGRRLCFLFCNTFFMKENLSEAEGPAYQAKSAKKRLSYGSFVDAITSAFRRTRAFSCEILARKAACTNCVRACLCCVGEPRLQGTIFTTAVCARGRFSHTRGMCAGKRNSWVDHFVSMCGSNRIFTFILFINE